jgi:hypothetical protein
VVQAVQLGHLLALITEARLLVALVVVLRTHQFLMGMRTVVIQ